MKRNNDYHYSSVTSFEDLRLEKTRLILKSKIMESKIKLDVIQIGDMFSIQALVMTVLRKFIPSDIYDLIEKIFGKQDPN